ncbi:MAG TPA: TonB-dependent receptor [Gemmatimonadaceae bacterium]|nr:TonB-dependent receptor [Gemmatimonadaceae bacterium]
MKRTLVILGLLISAGARPAHSQNPGQPPAGAPGQMPVATGEIRGVVMDTAAKTPVGGASISVRTKRDSSLVAGAIGGTDGTFRIQGLRPGVYNVRVKSIGYGAVYSEVTIAPNAPPTNLSFRLSHVAVELGEVEVRADRTVMVEADRNGYRAKDIAPSATNAHDVLEHIPSVMIDGEGKISLRGNENVAIQINGRPAPIRGTQLTSFLKGLPSNIVEKIEVIPNPSAKYDPEGMAGIINIQLKANADLGVSGGLTASGYQAGRFNTSGNVGYQSGPWTSFTSIGFNSDDRGLEGINNREDLHALGTSPMFTNQKLLGETGQDGQNFTTTVDYKINKRDVLTNALVVSHRTGSEGSNAAYTELNPTGALLGQYNRQRNSSSKSMLYDYDLVWKRNFEPNKTFLSAETRFNRSDDDDVTRQWKTPVTGSSKTEFETDTNGSLTKQLTGQVDYTKTFAPRTKLETGYKGVLRWLDRDYLVEKDPLGTGNWVKSNLSNAFNFDEDVQQVYGVLSQGYGKFDLTGGVRGEYATRDFQLGSKDYPYDKFAAYPSAAANYKYSDVTNLKASYSRRVRRPGTQELNPFPQYFDLQNVFIGNPALDPEYTDALELGYVRTGKFGLFQVSPFYRYTHNSIQVDIKTNAVLDGNKVTTISFKNLDKSESWGTDVNGQLRLGPKLNLFTGFNVFKIVTDGGSTSSLQADGVTWSYRINLNSQLTKTFSVSAQNAYRAPMNFPRGRFSSFSNTSISLRQKIQGDAMSVSLRFVDPFNQGRFKVRVGDDNLVQITERQFGVRGTFLTFQYNFGQTPKIKIPQPEQQQQGTGFPSG